jgi:hypothetical protein
VQVSRYRVPNVSGDYSAIAAKPRETLTDGQSLFVMAAPGWEVLLR